MALTIALAGNPNSGKTTLFNALTGSNQYVGNWPGVTVEKKEGKYKYDSEITITDLPGIYSLSPYSLEEVVTRKYLITEKPDVILNIVDGTNLERNLYLTTQLSEIGIPMVVAVNMIDIVRKKGDSINIKKLSDALKCKVLEISALKEEGIKEAIEACFLVAEKKKMSIPVHGFSGSVEHSIAHIEEAVLHDMPEEYQRWFAIKLFERDEKVIEYLNLDEKTLAHIEEDIKKCEDELDDDSESIITNDRYTYIASIIGSCYTKKNRGKLSTSDKIDKIVTNRWLALPIFAAIMFLVYYISVSTVGDYVTVWTNDGLFGDGFKLFGTEIWVPGIPVIAENLLQSINCAAWLQDLIINGIIAGVGAVLGFVPQLLVLFFFLAFLEGSGYMARVAFIMDRIFRKFGLSGKSFIPMLVGTGCGVPGIMASRTIENDKDRKMTIITTTFIPCGAKLPIIILIGTNLFNGAWWIAPSAYFVGIFAIIVSGIILKKTKIFLGDPAPFVMELPAYHVPAFSNVTRSMLERGGSFIKKAGTIILLSTIVIWFTSSYGFENGSFGAVSMENSLLAMVGNVMAPIFRPLGFGNWQSSVATVTGLIAKENVVTTFGILEGIEEVSESTAELMNSMNTLFTPLSGYSFLVFNLLCAPCFAAIGAIKREMNDFKWTIFAVMYQCLFAYVISLMIYQFGMLFTTGQFGILTIVAILIFGFLLYSLFKPSKKH